MGLWEFLRQWRPSRITIGILASILLHLSIVAVVLWGGLLLPHSRREVKKGDALIVDLPKPEEPASAGSPSAPPPPPSRPAPPNPPAPPVASPKQPAAAPTPRPAPAPEERRVASAPRPPAPAPPAPKAADAGPSLPRGTDPTPAPPEPTPKAPEATAKAPEPPPAPAAPAAPARPPADQQVASLPPGGQPSGPAPPDMRTALARGGGLTGKGRGGIEGDPIPLDSDNPRFNDYLEQLRRRIQEKWVYPCIKTGQNCEYLEATLEIEFGIRKDGVLQFIEVVRNSDYPVYDEYAANAIKLASPFPPVPAIMMSNVKPGSAGVPIRARFVYLIVKSSLTNLLR